MKRGVGVHNAGGITTSSDISADQPGRRRMQKLFRRAQSSLDPRRRAADRDRLSAGSDVGKRDLDTYSSESSREETPSRPIPSGPAQTGIKRQYDQIGRSASDHMSGQGFEGMSAASGVESLDSSHHSDCGGLVLEGQAALMVTSTENASSPQVPEPRRRPTSEPVFKQDGMKSFDNSANTGESERLFVGFAASNKNYHGPPATSETHEQHPADSSIMSLTKVKPVTIASFKPTHPYYPGGQPVPCSQSTYSSRGNTLHDRRLSSETVCVTTTGKPVASLAQEEKAVVSPDDSGEPLRVSVEETLRKDVSAECQKSPDLAEVLDLIDVHFNMAHENESDTSDTNNITPTKVLDNVASVKTERVPSFVQPSILTTENGAVLNISPRSRSRMHKQDSPKVRKVIKPDLTDLDRDSPSPERDELVRNLKTEFDELFPQERLETVKNHFGMANGASSMLSTPDETDVFTDASSVLSGSRSSRKSSYISAMESRTDTETETCDLPNPDLMSSPEKAFTDGSPSKNMQFPRTEGINNTGVSPRSHKPVKAEYSVSTTSRVLGADAGRRSRHTSMPEHEVDDNRLPDMDLSRSALETKREVSRVLAKYSISYESGLENVGGAESKFSQSSDSTEFVTSVKDMCLDFSRKLGLQGADSLETDSTTDSGIMRDQSEKPFFSENAEKFRSISSKDLSRKFNTWSGARLKKQGQSLVNEQVTDYYSFYNIL